MLTCLIQDFKKRTFDSSPFSANRIFISPSVVPHGRAIKMTVNELSPLDCCSRQETNCGAGKTMTTWLPVLRETTLRSENAWMSKSNGHQQAYCGFFFFHLKFAALNSKCAGS